MSDIPPPPPGFTLVDEPAPRAPRRTRSTSGSVPPPPPGFDVLPDDHPEAVALLGKPTGAVHDGDTFALDSGQNARLYGVDAFELNQTGRTRSGTSVPLGQEARNALVPYAQPDALVTPTGAMTYGRPVASLDRRGDAATDILRQGYGIATPEYLKADPQRFGNYMEAERDARLNRRGAWAGSFDQPASYRHGTPDPWAKPVAGAEGNSEAVFWDEPLPAQGLRPEIAQGWIALHRDPTSMAAAAKTLRTGEAADAVTKLEQQTQYAISGVKGSIIRTPTRLLSAEDEFFKGIARRMELAGMSVREAAKEGHTGAAAKTRAAELLANPTDDMLARSFEYGRYLTFQNALGPVGRHVTAITEAMPALKLILPFVRTPTNILKFAAERSPLAPLMKTWRNDLRAGGAKADMAIARAMVGTGVAASIFQLAQDGKITGGGPADREAKRLLQRTGWQPYSFKIGDKYVSYQRLDPYSTTIGTAADIVDLQRYMTDKQRDESAMLVGTAILHNLGNKTWLSGLSDALEALNDPDRSLDNFTSRMAGSIAVPALVAQAARTADPVLREARGPLDRIRSRVPGLSSKLYPRRDVFGRAITTEGGLGPDIISPIWASTDKPDPTVNALLEVGAHVTAPGKKVAGRELTPAEYDQWQVIVGDTIKPELDALVSFPGWKQIPADERKDMIDDTVRKARKTAKATFLSGGNTAANALPPPPPGYTLAP